MTGAFEGRGSGATGIPREHLAELGVRDDQVLFTNAGLPDRLLEIHLEAWSYTPDFTGLVQLLLQHLQSERNLSIAVCGSPADSRARAHAALQLSIGLTQHGRSVAVVDADATLPGLAGLIGDPHSEGLIDMVRFGRSCRSLLWKPLQTGPSVLPLGSFPLRGRLPFDADAVRGVLHRVALHTDVALYVAPIVEGEQLHPIVHACGQVVHVQGPESAARGLDPDLVAWVTRGSIRLVGLVFHTAEVPLGSVPPLPAASPGWQPPTPEGAPPAQQPPRFEAADLEPALDALEPQDEEPRVSLQEPLDVRGQTASKTTAEVERSPAESAEVREMLRLGETEFAYDEQVSYSRTPLYLLITLVVLIGGFLGWVLWTERGIERRQLPAARDGSTAAAEPPSSARPDAVGAAAAPPPAVQQPEDAANAVAPDDAAAQPQTQAVADAEPAPTTPTTTPTTAAQSGGTASPAAGDESSGAAQSTPPSGVAYSVHVASYQKAARAQSDIENLRKHGFEARSIRTDLGSKGIWYRVYVGSYPSRAAAAEAREAVLKLPEYSFAQVRRAPAP
jgi:cell division septation protein DedD